MTLHPLLAAWEDYKARASDFEIASKWAVDLGNRTKIADVALVLADNHDFDEYLASLRAEKERFALCVRLLKERRR
jgi:hypothetical protein